MERVGLSNRFGPLFYLANENPRMYYFASGSSNPRMKNPRMYAYYYQRTLVRPCANPSVSQRTRTLPTASGEQSDRRPIRGVGSPDSDLEVRASGENSSPPEKKLSPRRPAVGQSNPPEQWADPM